MLLGGEVDHAEDQVNAPVFGRVFRKVRKPD